MFFHRVKHATSAFIKRWGGRRVRAAFVLHASSASAHISTYVTFAQFIYKQEHRALPFFPGRRESVRKFGRNFTSQFVSRLSRLFRTRKYTKEIYAKYSVLILLLEQCNVQNVVRENLGATFAVYRCFISDGSLYLQNKLIISLFRNWWKFKFHAM